MSSMPIHLVQSSSRNPRVPAEISRLNRYRYTLLSNNVLKGLDRDEVSRSAYLFGNILGLPYAKGEQGVFERAWVLHDLWGGIKVPESAKDIKVPWDGAFENILLCKPLGMNPIHPCFLIQPLGNIRNSSNVSLSTSM